MLHSRILRALQIRRLRLASILESSKGIISSFSNPALTLPNSLNQRLPRHFDYLIFVQSKDVEMEFMMTDPIIPTPPAMRNTVM